MSIPRFRTALPLLVALFLALGTAACAGDDHEHGADTHTHEEAAQAEADDHEHGEGTHTHDAMVADTAGTYVDTTGAFFKEDTPPAGDDHEHGAESHTHGGEAHSHDDQDNQ